jgi:hypothetical protein
MHMLSLTVPVPNSLYFLVDLSLLLFFLHCSVRYVYLCRPLVLMLVCRVQVAVKG